MKHLFLFWEKNFLFYELFLSVLIWTIALGWFWYIGFSSLLDLLYNNRSTLYGTLASIFATLLGFSITAISIVLGFISSERFTIVREGKHYSDLWKVFSSSIYSLGAATISSLVALVFDKDNSPYPVLFWVVFFCFIISCFRIWRVVWILEKIVKISQK